MHSCCRVQSSHSPQQLLQSPHISSQQLIALQVKAFAHVVTSLHHPCHNGSVHASRRQSLCQGLSSKMMPRRVGGEGPGGPSTRKLQVKVRCAYLQVRCHACPPRLVAEVAAHHGRVQPSCRLESDDRVTGPAPLMQAMGALQWHSIGLGTLRSSAHQKWLGL